MTEQDTTTSALFAKALETGQREDLDAAIEAWKRLCEVLDRAEVRDA
jgi:hypothetical protein